MAGNFDPNDRDSWYFGALQSRDEANKILDKENENGVFLVRDSTTIKGDFVLCVKEENRNSHYIINKILVGGEARFRIGDQEFTDLPALLSFYKTHYLDTTPLTRPVNMDVREKYIAKYDFEGRDPEDLPFKKGEILTLLRKDEDQWWTAKNNNDRIGQVPVPYLEPYVRGSVIQAPPVQPQPQPHPVDKIPPLPAMAVAIKQRIPSAFDKTALKLNIGDIVKVLTTNINGQWEGECNGKKGLFPFNYIRFYEGEENEES